MSEQKKFYVSVRIGGDSYAELSDVAHSFFPFPVSVNDVLHALPRSPCCNALLLQLPKDGEIICTKCKKKYRLEEVKQ
jgi:uncharacterized protein YbaR (Trm112 family)